MGGATEQPRRFAYHGRIALVLGFDPFAKAAKTQQGIACWEFVMCNFTKRRNNRSQSPEVAVARSRQP